MGSQGTLRVKLVKSLIGSTKPQLATARALGLRRIGDITNQPNNAATKGKLRVLAHLLEVTECPNESADSSGTPEEGGAEA